ncbi:hypothetical protein [Legionella maioricensis]|uniref:RNA binding protein (Contains ribosomal protein S1 domain) n=1 Tax=Legionella maioricensis TaxID=2896528 RepID=A0A9X2D063_9GAMM|nr:hypothetical protein [Legionella maioricensis]MCL9683894.1 hypothetical protein [Legionella maioricensis]MCL9686741.1 hypothetical protein [Legionella maioricensis]
MILYVPFPHSQAGDLVVGMESWKNEQSKISNESIHIIYHGDDFDFDATKALLSEVYICAHGFSDSLPLIVGNNRDLMKTECIGIRTVTERFNQDFGEVLYQIFAIHLYCCGSKNKNRLMAEEFRMDLLRKDIFIHSYAGSITTPDSNGVLWSFSDTQKVPVQETQSVLVKQAVLETPEHRMNFKTAVMLHSYEQSKEKRRHRFFAEEKAGRQAEIHRRRPDLPEETPAPAAAPPSSDEASATSIP